MAFLEVKNLTKTFEVRRDGKKSRLLAVNDVSFEIERGEILGVIGESGCGKSTLGKMLIGLETPSEGTIRYEGKDAKERIKKDSRAFHAFVQMVFQNPFDTFLKDQTIGQILVRALKLHQIGTDKAERIKIAKQAMEEAGMSPAEDFIERYPHELSGGQLQRVSIIRSMLLNPQFIVADEPVSMLDVSVRADIMNVLLDLTKKKNAAMMFISHDLAATRYISDRVVVMYLGQIVESGNTDEVIANPKHPYTIALLSNCASIDPTRKQEFIEVPGEPPATIEEKKGCYFAPRCFRATERCFMEAPSCKHFENGHCAYCHFVD